MSKARHPNIIEFIAAIERGKARYLLFRWAEEGHLRSFWRANSRPTLSGGLVADAVRQIKGLADALDQLHTGRHRPGGESFRHGDLKPENILCVTVRQSSTEEICMPQLKISDMGLTKPHNVATELRPPTSMQYTTKRYEPPEVLSNLDAGPGQGGRSRRYDMWSLGCVILETIIWLLFGTNDLESFNKKVVDDLGIEGHWFEVKKQSPKDQGRPVVHRHVQDTIRALLRDPECVPGTAMRDLLDIVREKLLVVELGNATMLGDFGSPRSRAGCRVYSEELTSSLNEMVRKGEQNERYWFTGKSRSRMHPLVPVPDPESGPIEHVLLSPQAALSPGQRIATPTHQRDGSDSAPAHDTIRLAVPMAELAVKTRRVGFADVRSER